MELDIESIQNGSRDGEVVWICHYSRPDLDKKPLRNVPPTKVTVMPNSTLPEGKNVYYSSSHFRPLNAKGDLTAKIISPVDNTGYRSIQGNPLHVFTDEVGCITAYNAQVDEHIARVEERIRTAQQYWEDQKATMLALKKGKY